jgi:hypothetical protein
MNLLHFCLIGIVLVLLVTPIQNLTNKTVRRFKARSEEKKQILSRLNDFTQEICTTKMVSHNFTGVEKGIMSPHCIPRLTAGWQCYGDGISFIVTKDNPNIVQVTSGEKKILIWAKQIKRRLVWYYFDNEKRKVIKIKGELARKAESLCLFAHKKHRKLQSPKAKAADLIREKRDKLRQLHPEVV